MESEKIISQEYGLIGEKLTHSYSKLIHSRLGSYEYELCEIAPDRLDSFLTERKFKGLNVTIPYKKTVIPYCTELSGAAARIGSVNTLIVRSDGSLYGHNTDYDGFIYAVKSAGISFSGKKILILGSGGTSLTVKAAAEDLGAAEIITVSRGGDVNYQNIYLHTDAGVIVNTTPVGMYPKTGLSPVDLGRFPALSGVVDVIYNPLYTALLLQARKLGIPHTCGLPMLVAQAKSAAELFLSRKIADSETQRICREIMGEITNIVLIGMPGSGKTSLGRRLAAILNKKFTDTDDIIAERAGMSIPDIFEKFGEAHFRELEAGVVRDVGKEKGLVIATGGGAALKEQNRDALRQNGRVYYVTRELRALGTQGRPLSTSIEALRELEIARSPLYNALCDVKVANDGELEAAAGTIAEDFYENFGH